MQKKQQERLGHRRKPIQFDWRRNWSKKVAPHLNHPLVQASLDLGMTLLDPNWRTGDPPYLLGSVPSNRTRVVPGKLSWYQVWGRCHWIAFFSMAIGVLNYPHLVWRFVSNERHTVPAGYDAEGKLKVVMDLLLFRNMNAEESIALAQTKVADTPNGEEWEQCFQVFINEIVPLIRASMQAIGRCSGPSGN